MSFVLITLMHIHLVSVAFSIYYHRAAAHQQMTLSKPLEHIFRFILYTAEQGRHHLWLRVVVATHLNHHRHSDTINDYLSPHHHKPFLWYIHSKLAKPLNPPEDFSDIDKYARHIPEQHDWIQRNVYTKIPFLGMLLVTMIYVLVCGWWAFIPGLLLTCWLSLTGLPLLGDYIIHVVGYSNKLAKDKSTNFVPWGILMGGEELHSNHHVRPGQLNHAHKWWEFDIGYWYCVIFEKLGLLTIKPRALKRGN